EKINQYAEPTGWRQANVKEYKAFVAINDPTPDLRTGMTAAVTIRCAEVPNALQVPVQAIYAHGSKFYCFVYDKGGWEAREVKPGPTNDKFFVIESGLNEGDQVAMNPRAYLNEVTLPKLSPDEAQRVVPQALAGELEAEGASAAGQPGGKSRGGPGGRAGRQGGPPQGPGQPGEPTEQQERPGGDAPGDTRVPTGPGAAGQVQSKPAASTATAGAAQ
ncbi:MAG: hypothetical protein WD468_12400, partial [Pirellulales bacterium]